MPDKTQFLTPFDMLPHKAGGVAVAEAINPTTILGTWTNVNAHTPNLIKAVITEKGTTANVHFFGACTPTPCDWGAVPAVVYAANVTATAANAFTAIYKFGFKDVVVTGHLEGTQLVVETFNHFTDHSGRADYYYKDVMHK